MKRREFVQTSAVLAGGAALGGHADLSELAFPFTALQPIKAAPKITTPSDGRASRRRGG